MKKSNQQKVSKLALGLYILSFFMLVMTGYSVYNCYIYVASIVEQGFVISENLNDTISYYLSSVTPYAFYTICLGAMALYCSTNEENCHASIKRGCRD